MGCFSGEVDPLRRRDRSPAWLLLGAILLAAGCNKPTTPGNSTSPGNSAAAKDAVPDAPAESVVRSPKAYLEGWNKPAAALVLTGEIHGYLEPCGCSLKQSGGFARRASLLSELKAKEWPVASLDAGGLLKKSQRQDQIKFEAMLAGMQKLDYAGLALGTEELLLGPDFLLAQHVAEDDKAISFLDANVVLYDSPEIGTPRPWKIVPIGDVKVGVTSILGLSHKDTVSPDGVINNITLKDPQAVLPDIIQKMEAEQPDFLVLLSHGTTDEAKQLAEAFPQFRIILTAGGPDEASGKPIVVNETWIIETGTKGRSVGVLAYYPQKSVQPFRFELIELDSERFKNHPSMTAVMQSYQQRLKDERISEKSQLPDPPGGTFVGAETCGECHKKSYDHWKTTDHVKGFETLLHGRHEEDWVPRQFDPECLSCHVTGWEPQQMKGFKSGYFSQEMSAHLLGQQCENCHGPGSQHTDVERAYAADVKNVAAEELEKLRELVRRSYDTAEKKVCIQCHDAENSPDFKFEEAWKKIEHPWRD